MPFTAKYTGQRGKVNLADIAKTAGTAEAQRDTISVNMDIDKMSKGDALLLIAKIRDAIHTVKWPPA
jgi:hypothetical protein